MPWKETTPMEEIIRGVTLARGGHFTVTERCAQFLGQPKIGYNHLVRFAAEGMRGLQTSRRRSQSGCDFKANVTATRKLALPERRRHRTWTQMTFGSIR